MDGVRASGDIWAAAIAAATANPIRAGRPVATQRTLPKLTTANIVSVGAADFYAHVSQGRFVLTFAKHRLPGMGRPAPEYSRDVFTIRDLKAKAAKPVEWAALGGDPTTQPLTDKLKRVQMEKDVSKKEKMIYSDPELCAYFVDVCGLAMDPVSRNRLQYVTTLTKGHGLVVNEELFMDTPLGEVADASCRHILLVFTSQKDAKGYFVEVKLQLSDRKSLNDGKTVRSHYIGYVADVYRGTPTSFGPLDTEKHSRVSLCICSSKNEY